MSRRADAARYLAAMHPDAIFSSDLVRAAETAAYLAELTGLPVQLDKDLRERGGGAWEGLTDAEIRASYPEAYAAWVPPDGEPIPAVADRVAAVLTRIADSLDGTLAVLVSHGAAINLGISPPARPPRAHPGSRPARQLLVVGPGPPGGSLAAARAQRRPAAGPGSRAGAGAGRRPGRRDPWRSRRLVRRPEAIADRFLYTGVAPGPATRLPAEGL